MHSICYITYHMQHTASLAKFSYSMMVFSNIVMGQFQRSVEGVLPSELKAAWHSTTVITMLFFRTAIFSESIAASHLHSIASSSGMAAAT